MKAIVYQLMCALCVMPFSVLAETYPAELAWAGKLELSVPVSGVVEQVNVMAGQAVNSGTVMLALDDSVFKANVAAARAQLKSSSIDLEEAQREFNRAEELYASTVLSDRDLQLAEIAYEKINAHFYTAKADMALAQYELDHAVIKAPFDAIVIERRAMPGEVLIQTYQPRTLLTVAKQAAMVAVAEVPEDAIARIELGQAAGVTVNGASISGRISAIDYSASAEKYGALAVHVEFTVPDGQRLFPGMKAEVELP